MPKAATPAASIGQQKGCSSSPLQHLTLHVREPVLQKLNELSYKVLPTPPYIHLLSRQLTSSISATFCRGSVFQEFTESQSMEFYTTEINKQYISHWQKCVDGNGSHFD